MAHPKSTTAGILACVAGGIAVVALVIALQKPAVQEKFGALAGPDIPSAYLHWGASMGAYYQPTVIAPTTATTTVCAIQSPAATSSLISGGVILTVSSTTASTVTLAKAATAFATTTILAQSAVSAGAQGTIVASSTSTGMGPLDPNQVFGPSTWLVVGMQGNTGTFSPSGRCFALFESYGL